MGTAGAGGDSWRKSSFSAESSCCVEVNLAGPDILVRDTKYARTTGNDPATGPTLAYTPAEWRAFVAGVKAGEFDL